MAKNGRGGGGGVNLRPLERNQGKKNPCRNRVTVMYPTGIR